MKHLYSTKILKKLALVAALLAWGAVPYLTSGVKADSTPVIIVRTASLTAPAGSVNPHGMAVWQLYQSGNREIEVEIEDVTLASGTMLNVVVDGTIIGQIAVQVDQRGKLKLKTEDGQSVPAVNAGSTVSVRNGDKVLVAGVFGGGPNPSPTVTPSGTPTGTPTASPSPTATPSPSPGGTPNPGDLFAGLTGPTLNGVVPTGFAAFEVHSSRTELEVRVRQVNLPFGTALTVIINDTNVGTMFVQSGLEARLRLRSDNGQTVPLVAAGSGVAVMNGQTAVLKGTFGGITGPSATPSPGPGATTFGRSFEAEMASGAASGEVKLALNAAENQATVFGEFHNLPSNQTGARIETNVGTPVTLFDLGVVGGLNGNFSSVTFPITPTQVQAIRSGFVSAVITSASGELRAALRPRSSDSDLNGDGSSDYAVFRPTTGTWYSLFEGGWITHSFGGAGDKLVPGDYDGDGRTDLGLFRQNGGAAVWEILRSSDSGTTTVVFGFSTDIPVRGDFDGDGRADIAVYRPSNGTWYIQKSDNSGYLYVPFGLAEDRPIAADMDGDGKDDIAVFRPSDGTWYWQQSSDGQYRGAQWGQAGDVPVKADFDGDGKNDLTVFRPANGTWYSYRTSDGGFQGAQWGTGTDIPVAGDYDGDNRADIAVFRPSDGKWYILRSSDGAFQGIQFGLNGDIPLIAY